MADVIPLADHIAPDSIGRLRRAAQGRFEEAVMLIAKKRYLTALYLFGYSVEMCLTAAYFRRVGFDSNRPIDRETRARRMAQARQLRTSADEPMMSSDPHPLVGWARFLEWQRSQTKLSNEDSQRLKEAIHRAEKVYKHWRPHLRYKTSDVALNQLNEVHWGAAWFLGQQGRL